MRTLSSTLAAAQKQNAGIDALVRIVLSRTGQTTRTYTKTRLLTIDHREEPFSQKADVVLSNADDGITSLDFKGFKGVISYGINTSAGEEYSACAPLYVTGQQQLWRPGGFDVILSLQGIPNELEDDKASAFYLPGLADTAKDIINGILAATIAPYSHCTAYTVDWDAEDNLIDSYLPKQTFRILEGKSRLTSVAELLRFSRLLMRVEADEHIAIFVPPQTGDTWLANTAYVAGDYVQPVTPNNNFTYKCTTAGTSHASTEPTWPTTDGGTVSDGTAGWTAVDPDADYRLSTTYHHFFSKAHRTRLVNPNYVTINSYVGDSPAYSGYATHSDYLIIRKDGFSRARLASNAQATSLAKAAIAQAQMSQEYGSGEVPMNVGAEALDWIKMVDATSTGAEGTARLGTVGFIHRKVNFRKNEWKMSLGLGNWITKQSLQRSLTTSTLGTDVGEGALTNIALNQITDVGTTLLHSNDTSAASTSATYVKVREILIPCFGYLRVKFDLQTVDAGPPAVPFYGRIYRNGAAIGTERSDDTGSYQTFSEDFDGFKPGDLLQLYVHSNGVINSNYRNFRLYWDSTGQVNPYTPLFVNIM